MSSEPIDSSFQTPISTPLNKAQEQRPMLHESFSQAYSLGADPEPRFNVARPPVKRPLSRQQDDKLTDHDARPTFSAKRKSSGDWHDREGSPLSRSNSPAKKHAGMLGSPGSPSRGVFAHQPVNQSLLHKVTPSLTGLQIDERSLPLQQPQTLPTTGAADDSTSCQPPTPDLNESSTTEAKGQPPKKSTNEDLRSLITKQPPCQEITQHQLAREITAIYKTLVQVEAKCVSLIAYEFAILRDHPEHVEKMQDAEHWQALIALHRTLLHEHHDFFLASQHPSSGPALREIATKYSMPARMWKHGIHNFLELLRRHLPLSMEFMLAFIYLAYQMMALLFETVPGYKDTWIECLGDLARYRMAIEEEDLRDREIWTGVARMWYCKAVGRSPRVGRLQHHLAILARTNAVEQLSLYARSLAAEQPFASTRGSIMTLIEPMLARRENKRQLSVDTWFVKVHGLIFTNGPNADFSQALDNFTSLLEKGLEQTSSRWRQQGAYFCIANVVSCLGWGLPCQLRDELLEGTTGENEADVKSQQLRNSDRASPIALQRAHAVFIKTLEIVLAHHDDPNTYNNVFIALTFLITLKKVNIDLSRFSNRIIWERLASLLNLLMAADNTLYSNNPFTHKKSMPLPEEWYCQAQIWCRNSTPAEWLVRSTEEEEDDESKRDDDKALKRRQHRLVAMGKELQGCAPDNVVSLRFANDTKQFTVGVVTSPTTSEPARATTQMEIRTRPQD